jgi:hypothetical protein
MQRVDTSAHRFGQELEDRPCEQVFTPSLPGVTLSTNVELRVTQEKRS